MKKFLLLVLPIFICACAGNPPAWWNPSGKYQMPETHTATSDNIESPSVDSTDSSISTFTPVESVFEEMIIEPLPDESVEIETEDLVPSILEK